uniref:CSON002754 protein n=1 Tax=Culicoides sonorensis TaxID=179676 RepID=A0A336MXS4_CULSO
MNLQQNLIIYIIFMPYHIFSYNISPVPNYVFKPPNIPTFMEQQESSLFGYSLTLKKNSILIGAPKAQTHLASQRRVNETGGLYKCNFENGACEPFIVDIYGNTVVEDTRFAYNSEKKDFQLLGYTMDGLSSDNSKFVVCAPKLKANLEHHYLLHGACYWTSSENDNTKINRIASLRARDQQVKTIEKHNVYFNMYGQQGFSVHITENSEEILMGAPGIYNWKGSVIRYRPRQKQKKTKFGQLDNNRNNGIEYVSEIINPMFIGISEDSYLGYAVTSAYFAGGDSYRLLYAASAPQANDQVGKVFIFDFVEVQNNFVRDKTMKIYREFESQQMGEYFGYSLLAEDINNDGYPDLLIGAPMHSKNSYFESGAVYIYLNTGKLTFELQILLTSDYLFGGRFGTSMSKLGDLNQDGYNDVAIGAPMEGNGVVYIYHGSAQGLMSKPSQKVLPSGSQIPTKFPGLMFGHSISTGVDIDSNGYNDIAIGAPYGEEVFIYKTYPIVQISATIITDKKEIGKNDTRFQTTACWRLFSSTTNITHDLEFNILLKADTKHGRAKWINNNKFYELNVTINNQVQCHEFDVAVFFNIVDIFKPIEIEMEYRLVNQLINSTQFCDKCVVLHENSVESVRTSVVFSTGCKSSMCIADLRIKSSLSGSRLPYILGSTRTLAVKYDVENFGETAYLAQIKITLSNVTSFAKVPSNCKMDEDEMICDLESGNPLFPQQKSKLIVNIDTSRLSGKQLVIKAEAFSNGEEANFDDNKIINVMELIEYSEIEIQGHSSMTQFAIEDPLSDPTITHELEIINQGPSTIRDLSVMIFIPTRYLNEKKDIKIFNRSDLMVEVRYKDSLIPVTWYHENKLLEDNLNDDSSTLSPDSDLEIAEDEFDIVTSKNEESKFNERRRRSISGELGQLQQQRHQTILDELPFNRTIHFNCRDNYVEEYSCMQIYFNVNNVQAVGKDVIKVKINYLLQLNALNQVFDEHLDIFAMQPLLMLTTNVGDNDDDKNVMTYKITEENLPVTIVFKHFNKEFALWIYIVAILAGLLVLIIMSLILYKCGFFKRQVKEELERLTQNENYTSYSNNIDDDEKY